MLSRTGSLVSATDYTPPQLNSEALRLRELETEPESLSPASKLLFPCLFGSLSRPAGGHLRLIALKERR